MPFELSFDVSVGITDGTSTNLPVSSVPVPVVYGTAFSGTDTVPVPVPVRQYRSAHMIILTLGVSAQLVQSVIIRHHPIKQIVFVELGCWMILLN